MYALSVYCVKALSANMYTKVTNINGCIMFTVVEPAIGEYHELNTRYQIEHACREAAEDFATKVIVCECVTMYPAILVNRP